MATKLCTVELAYATTMLLEQWRARRLTEALWRQQLVMKKMNDDVVVLCEFNSYVD